MGESESLTRTKTNRNGHEATMPNLYLKIELSSRKYEKLGMIRCRKIVDLRGSDVKQPPAVVFLLFYIFFSREHII